jgi:hypothetical protein
MWIRRGDNFLSVAAGSPGFFLSLSPSYFKSSKMTATPAEKTCSLCVELSMIKIGEVIFKSVLPLKQEHKVQALQRCSPKEDLGKV